jgi:hypothetical protein
VRQKCHMSARPPRPPMASEVRKSSDSESTQGPVRAAVADLSPPRLVSHHATAAAAAAIAGGSWGGDRGRAPLFRTLSLTFFSLGFAIFFAAGCLVPSPLLSRRAALRWRPCNCMYLEAAFSFTTPVPVRSGYRVQRGEVDAMSSVSWRKL